MSERGNHRFDFRANQIADAADREVAYHLERLRHWKNRKAVSLRTVKKTAKVKIVEHEVTCGTLAQAVVEFGDPEAWQECVLACDKIQSHQAALDRYRTDARLYKTQGQRTYELDADDVHHFRLGGQKRPE